jgi:hypothetical protein
MSKVTSIYTTYAGRSTPPDHGWRPDPKGPTINIYEIGGGRSRTSGITSQGGHHRRL